MKKYIYLLAALLLVCGKAHAQYKFQAPFEIAVPPQGGEFQWELAYDNPGSSGPIQLVPGDIDLLEYQANSHLVKSVKNNGCAFSVEFEMTDVDFIIDGEIRMHLHVRNDSRQLWVTLNYRQDSFSEFFGGVIEFDGQGVYKKGSQPPMITSYRPALGGYISLVPPFEPIYTWEKSSVANPVWTAIHGKTETSCLPDIMDGQSVYYRRKAIKGDQIAYSNTIGIMSELSAGLITLSESGSGTQLYIFNKKDASVAWEFVTYQMSADLTNWTKIDIGNPSGQLLASIPIPTRTTYYRRMAEDTNGNKAYSNMVRYSLEEDAHITTKTALDAAGSTSNADIAYYDGLGRPSQSIQVGGSPSGNDIVTPYCFDAKGRQPNDYLPYVPTPGGSYRIISTEDLLADQDTYYRTQYSSSTSLYPYTHREYDSSPLDRVTKSFRQGAEYQSLQAHFVETRNELNQRGEVLRLQVDADGSLTFDGTSHTPGTLYKTVVVDEDGGIEATFTDASGRTVLVRRYLSSTDFADTYSVYDTMDRLRWVVSPEGSSRLSAGTKWRLKDDLADKYCYRYLYDGQGNITTRSIPGRPPELTSYDAAGRVQTSQSGAMAENGVCLCHYYDALGRPSRIALEGKLEIIEPIDPVDPPIIIEPIDPVDPPIIIDPVDPPVGPPIIIDPFEPPVGPPSKLDLEARMSSPAVLGGKFPPPGSLSHDTQRYRYDTYDLSSTFSAHVFTPIVGVVGMDDLTTSSQGLKTHEEIFETFESLSFKFGQTPTSCLRTFYYDVRHRPLQSFETTPSGQTLRVSYKYDYPGNVVLREEYYSAPGVSPQTIRYSCTYDSRGRQLSEQTTVNGTTQSTVATAYDALGRVQSTQFPAIGVSQTSEYDIRGWLTSLQSAPFSQSLRYTSPAPGFSTPSYTGNITQWSWRHGADSPESSYAFRYDALSRLTDAQQSENGILSDRFVERGLSYDRNSNLLTLQRISEGVLSDNLSYHYSGNRLMSLGGSRQANYTYDCMGNMTRDGVHNLDLSYNYLNLLKKVTRQSSTIANYRYLWDGTKVSATNGAGNGLSYQGSLVYNKQGNALSVEGISFSGGRIVATNNGLETHYFITDHLGSVRVVLNSSGAVQERNDYHPFGLRWNGNQLSDNRHRYNGKEEQMFVNIPYNDHGARMYDPRYRIDWNGADMLSADHPWEGTHVFCGNNPINNVDPDGRDWLRHIDSDQYIWRDDVTSRDATPEGYLYLGANNNDILADMGVSSIYTQSGNRKYLFTGALEPDANQQTNGSAVAAVMTAAQGLLEGADAVGVIAITANDVRISENVSKTNTMGRTFTGVTVAGALVQPAGVAKAERGTLQVTHNNFTTTSRLKEARDGVVEAGATILVASVNIPAGQINSSTVLQQAFIGAGTTGTQNSRMIIRPIKMNFGLQTTTSIRRVK